MFVLCKGVEGQGTRDPLNERLRIQSTPVPNRVFVFTIFCWEVSEEYKERQNDHLRDWLKQNLVESFL